jgi:hypothetical protein
MHQYLSISCNYVGLYLDRGQGLGFEIYVLTHGGHGPIALCLIEFKLCLQRTNIKPMGRSTINSMSPRLVTLVLYILHSQEALHNSTSCVTRCQGVPEHLEH